MSITITETRMTYKYLMSKSKSELIDMISMLWDEKDWLEERVKFLESHEKELVEKIYIAQGGSGNE